MKTTATFFSFLLLLFTCVAGTAQEGAAAQSEPHAPPEAKPLLRWAAATDSNAPYAFYDGDDKMVGFEVEIIHAIAQEMGRRPTFVPNDWDGLIPGLGRDLYDCVICGKARA